MNDPTQPGAKRLKAKMFTEGRLAAFTVHNYTDEHERLLLDWKRFSYVVFGHEKCPKTGTRHLQGYAEFGNSVKLSTWQNYLGVNIHAEVPLFCADRNYKYCIKHDPDGFCVRGEFRKQAPGRRTDITSAAADVKAGANMVDICDRSLGYQALRHAELLMKYTEPSPQRTAVEVIACQNLDDVFSRVHPDLWHTVYTPITMDNWDGYDGQLSVHLALHDCDRVYRLQKYMKPYPMRVNVKGGSREAKWTTVYVTGWRCDSTVEKYILSLV